jgi:hypothetical protein
VKLSYHGEFWHWLAASGLVAEFGWPHAVMLLPRLAEVGFASALVYSCQSAL